MIKLYHFFKKISSPKFCLSCLSQSEFYICNKCLTKNNFHFSKFCFECGKKINQECIYLTHSRLIKFLISFGKYENELLKRIILLGKEQSLEILKDIGYFISQEMKNLNFKEYYLTPVPLTKNKVIKRGYNQSEILAQTIANNLGINIFKGLIKKKETKDQGSLNYEARKTNLKGAFGVNEKSPSNIILVDDIKTTGATLKECAVTLKKAGAKNIIALTVLT